MHWFGPYIGAGLAALIYQLVFLAPLQRQDKEDKLRQDKIDAESMGSEKMARFLYSIV